jgi:HK97 family phage portal protein
VAFVVSDGALRGLSVPSNMPVARVRLAEDYTADYAAIWRTQGALRTVVDFLGRNIASLGLHQFRRVSDTDRQRVTDSGLINLLDRPNPVTTRYRLLDALVRDFGIYDRAYWLKVKAKDRPWLLRLPPAQVSPLGGSFWPEAFEFDGGKGKRVIPADQVVHFRGYSPDGDRGGAPPIEALRRVLAEEYEAGRMRENTLRNGARVSGYLERPAGAPSWSDTAADRFRASWRSQYAGGGPESGGTPILEDGMKFVAASQTAEQLQYVEARKLTREEVAAAFFIPPTMVGVMDSATFSNIREQHKHLYQDTLGPWLSMIAEELSLQLLPDFPDAAGTYLEFNLAEKLRGSFEEQAAQIQTSVGGPWMTRNEARALNNLPALEGGDELIVPLNVVEGGQASPSDSAPDTGALSGGAGGHKCAPALGPGGKFGVKAPGEPDIEAREDVVALFDAFFRRQRETVLAAIGGGSADWWDADRWDSELTADLYALVVEMSETMGADAAESFGFDPEAYDLDSTLAFLHAFAEARAGWVNETTRQQLDEVLAEAEAAEADPDVAPEDVPDPAVVFDNAEAQRAEAAGNSTFAALASFVAVEAGRRLLGDANKTWRTNSTNSRRSHARMDGETVRINQRFSNGLKWPGDPAKGPDEVAGCMCSVEVTPLPPEEQDEGGES